MRKIFFAIVLLFALIGFIRFVLGGPEDDWICSSGQWVRHGNPSASTPTAPCE